MKNTSEQILSYAENELIEKESIRRAVLSEKPERQKKPDRQQFYFSATPFARFVRL